MDGRENLRAQNERVGPFTVRAETDVRTLLHCEQLLHPFSKPSATIRVLELTRSEASAWEARFETLRDNCGCTSGAVAIGAFSLASVAYAFRGGSTVASSLLSSGLLRNGCVFVAGLILSAAFGKLLGLSVAMVRYRRTCFQLIERLQAITAARPSSILFPPVISTIRTTAIHNQGMQSQ